MSDDDNVFRFPSPEMEQHQKAMNAKQAKLEAKVKAGLPIIANIRAELRMIVELGFSGPQLVIVREQMAIFEEHCISQLHLPPHDCDG